MGHASLHVYEPAERGWYCFGRCQRGGTIYHLAAQRGTAEVGSFSPSGVGDAEVPVRVDEPPLVVLAMQHPQSAVGSRRRRGRFGLVVAPGGITPSISFSRPNGDRVRPSGGCEAGRRTK
jgi:hypothetical protein